MAVSAPAGRIGGAIRNPALGAIGARLGRRAIKGRSEFGWRTD